MRRVVVTGLGLVCPLGLGVDFVWRKLVAGKSGITRIENFDTSDLNCKIAGQAPFGPSETGGFNPDEWVQPKDQKKMDRFIVCAVAAAAEAVSDSGWQPTEQTKLDRTGVLIGSGIGGLPGIAETAVDSFSAQSTACAWPRLLRPHCF